MGACPKHRPSKMSSRKRRTHYKLPPLPLVKCTNCFELKLAHRVCPKCGHYNQKLQLFSVKAE